MNDDDRIILTDCDGVLLNWEYAFQIWMKSKGFVKDSGCNKYEYGVQHQYNIPPRTKNKLITEFNSSAAMGFLPPLRDAIHYVKKLHREEGFVFHCITSMSKDRNAQSLRKMNLRKLFGKTVFEKFIFLDTGADKDEVLLPYKDSGLFWIEDKLENAFLGKELGLSPILMEHSHNMIRSNIPGEHWMWERAKDIPRCRKWKNIYNHIIGE